MERVTILLILFALGGCAMPPPKVTSHEVALASDYYGSFKGDLITRALGDGRRLELIQPYAFEDVDGKLWGVGRVWGGLRGMSRKTGPPTLPQVPRSRRGAYRRLDREGAEDSP